MPYVGEIRMFAGSFAPVGWMFCQGQTIPISENETLFNLIGTTYGGDGQETYRLPDLQGRLPLHMGQGPGLSQSYVIGEQFGSEQVTLTVNQIPQHSHGVVAANGGGSTSSPQGNLLSSPPSLTEYVRDTPNAPLPPQAVGPYGGSQPHENRMPVLTINYIISMFGVFPSQ
ncbi:phage tail protein [Conexibacter woesei]|uniref:Tail Collar domain protein n=1 Tax=Conexibacter woesei (strain DSM 14684 / CCUG 47730 / CIP 108061 / JCM 11494 / NBRC 100937 / ID131577) TaxID=469383 RepID=D3F8R3_CONWI|nr:tail fiber protein [Conexibacter woesei]ADB51027.1 Tail Collar domain protein [Conexibacter woesei DSM 14684]